MSAFGLPATTGSTSSSLFGTSAATATPESSLFGTKPASSTVGALFSSTSTPQTSISLFGGKQASGAEATSTPVSTSTGSSLFSSAAGEASAFTFKRHPSTQAPTNLFGASPGTGMSGANLFLTPNKSGDVGKSQETPKISFGNTGISSAAGASGSLFGLTSASGGNSNTPAQSKMSMFGNSSTTPAGIPQTSNVPSTSLFSSASQSAPAVTGSSKSATSVTAPSLFATGAQPISAAVTSNVSQAGANKQPNSLFTGFQSTSTPSALSTGGASLTSNVTAPSQGSFTKPLFSNTTSAVSMSPTIRPSSATAGSSTLSSQAKPASVPQLASKPEIPTFSFSASNTSPTKPSPLTTAPSITATLSSLASMPSASSSEQLNSETGTLTGLASTAQQDKLKSVTAANTAAPKPSFSGNVASGTGASSDVPASTQSTSVSNINASVAEQRVGTNLGTSISGPKPTPQSRLKNKSMDEVITRWATDLQKYQKEFQKQATKVAEWDKILVTSSEQIQKLYGNTLEAERATAEIERQLSTVENDQSEIEYWLDLYEKQVDELIANQGSAGTYGENLQGPDAERERTFRMAEKLNDRLTEMSKDLGGMVDVINETSQGLEKGAKATDPLSQIVTVLNGHLNQLQTIDRGTNILQEKVAAAQAASRSVVGNVNLLGNTSAEDFLKSYTGRR